MTGSSIWSPHRSHRSSNLFSRTDVVLNLSSSAVPALLSIFSNSACRQRKTAWWKSSKHCCSPFANWSLPEPRATRDRRLNVLATTVPRMLKSLAISLLTDAFCRQLLFGLSSNFLSLKNCSNSLIPLRPCSQELTKQRFANPLPPGF